MPYYLRSMIRYWKRTWNVIRHYAGKRESEWSEITVDELYERINSPKPPLLLDIRSKGDYNGKYGHIPGAISIPLLTLESRLDEIVEYKDDMIVTMCPGGGLSLVAYELLKEVGFKNVKSLTGGTDEWRDKGYPLTSEA